MKRKPAYYTVFSIKDGTLVTALQTRKPLRQRGCRAPKIEEDGVHTEYIVRPDEYRTASDLLKVVHNVGISSAINTKRALRTLIEPRLTAIETQLASLSEKVDRLLAEISS